MARGRQVWRSRAFRHLPDACRERITAEQGMGGLMFGSGLWAQTWMVVLLGMLGVFGFLFLMVGGLRVMSLFINPTALQGKNGEKK
jgi:hypothetical protein